MNTISEESLRVGIVQFDIRPGEVAVNTDRAVAGIRRLAAEGAAMAVLPELWSSGFDNECLEAHAAGTPAILDIVAAIAVECNIVVAGSLPEKTAAGIYNTLYVHDVDGSPVGSYRKVHLFTPGREDRFFLSGDKSSVCRTSVGNFGLIICYDLRFPELCRLPALRDADGLIVCAQWPASRIQHWDVLLRARAIENQMMVIAANRCGRDPDLAYGGRSQIISPTGEVVAAAGAHDEAVFSAVLDKTEKARFRQAIPCFESRRTDVYC